MVRNIYVTFDFSLKTTSHSNQSYLQNSLCPTDLSGGADNSLAVAPLLTDYAVDKPMETPNTL